MVCSFLIAKGCLDLSAHLTLTSSAVACASVCLISTFCNFQADFCGSDTRGRNAVSGTGVHNIRCHIFNVEVHKAGFAFASATDENARVHLPRHSNRRHAWVRMQNRRDLRKSGRANGSHSRSRILNL
jgi:hypothetical protein